MKYIPIYLIIAVMLIASPSPARADEASKLAKATEMMQIAMGDQMTKSLEQTMKAMMATMGKDMPAEQRAKATEMSEKSMSLAMAAFNKARPALAKAYADTYTEEELDGILAFYRSPIGKSMMQKAPEASQRAMPVIMQVMNEVQAQMKTALDGIKK
jgi:hypothetical protein